MIIVQQKPLEEIFGMVENLQSLLILGCDGCAGIIEVGGEKQAEILKMLLEMRRKIKGLSQSKIKATSILRQCDKQIVASSLHPLIDDYDAVLSLACGVGIQTLGGLYPNKLVIPANDTKFLGMHDTKEGKFYEMCRACGDCILFDTGGICPITRCAKSLLNGPCGGQVNGKCEVGGWKKDCAWVLIYNRLKDRNRLDSFAKFRAPLDFRISEHPREIGGETVVEKKIETVNVDEISIRRKPEAYSELMKQIMDGKFVFTGELEPVKTTNLHEVIEGAKILKGHVVAVNVTDNPTAFGYMNALVPSYLIQEKGDLEAVYQMTTRDRNRLALLSDVLAAGALGIKNILVLTGDHTVVGDTPQSKPVFDLDSATFTYMMRKVIDEGVDLNGNKIENPPRFNIGIAAAPNADPLEPEILKIERKVKLGVDFIQTQCIYTVEQAKRFLDAIGYLKTPVLIGVAPFKSQAMMDWMIKFVPGIKVPGDVEQRLRRAKQKSKEAFLEENVEIFSELIGEIRKTTSAAGIHMMAVGFEWIVPKIIERSGIN
ncbi:MAG: methylenetetrahydrofolate reductase C-terminal domain-containing protein [Candidatus Bathyarchaeota archaeon]|nr:methylenetetrahydrofolate reductase C-terminal domain-containing protein [Candidatus Bathyarchaeota archaeon]